MTMFWGETPPRSQFGRLGYWVNRAIGSTGEGQVFWAVALAPSPQWYIMNDGDLFTVFATQRPMTCL